MLSNPKFSFAGVFFLYFTVLVVLFFPALFGQQTLMPSASDQPSIVPQGAFGPALKQPRSYARLLDSGAPAWQFEPGLVVTHHLLFEEHSLPWWNPYQGFGAPWAAGMISQPFFPLTILAATHPSVRVVAWLVIIRLLIAGLLAYSFLRMLLSAMPSCIGGLAFMLTGYFVINLNLDNLSTDILLPLALIAVEKLFRSSSAGSWLLAIFSVWLILISGMPESALVMLLFAYCYFLFRVFTSVKTQSPAWPYIKRLLISNLLAFGLSAFLLVPMLEFVKNGFDVHSGGSFGLQSVAFSRNILLYLLPLAAGPVASARFYNLQAVLLGYAGVSCCALALTAIVAAFPRRKSGQVPMELFFTWSLVVCLGKYFGWPPFQWLGYLPILKIVNFPHYLQPTMGFCFAALCAWGVDYILRRHVVDQAVFSILAVLCIAVILVPKFGLFSEVLTNPTFAPYTLLLPGCVGVVLLLALYVSAKWKNPRIAFALILTAVVGELSFNYLYPLYHAVYHLPAVTLNPYAGAPYLDFLKRREVGFDRVFGRQAELYPGWASAFQMFDSRFLMAITPGRLLPFARTFFKSQEDADELGNRFAGDALPYLFDTEREQRFLTLSSTKFLLSPDYLDHNSSDRLTFEILNQNATLAANSKAAFNKTAFTIDQTTRPVLFEHPPQSRIPLTVNVAAETPILQFSPALNPAVFESKCGDGVHFLLELSDSDKSIIPLYSRYIDPGHNLSQRHWMDEKIDLSRFAGRSIKLLFSTDGGPAGDLSCDWAGWANLSFSRKDLSSHDLPDFKLVYDAENKIYEFAHPLPRAALFHSIKIVSDESQALKLIADPSVDLSRQVIVVDPRLQPAKTSFLEDLQHATPTPVVPAQIVAFASQRVSIKTNSSEDGLLMLTDSFFPGWHVYVDNQIRTLLQANYMFRGVAVEKGSHVVEFRYEDSAVRTGGIISLCALIATVALLYSKRNAMLASQRIAK